MGRRSNYPIIFDELKIVTITDLKKFGYLKTGNRKGNLRWKCRGEYTGDVDIIVWLSETDRRGSLQFIYTYNKEKHYHYFVDLIAVPTNLGIGLRWYFLCHVTGERCTKLHLANGYFQHRSGIKGAFYETQTRSRYSRLDDRYWRSQEQIFTPYLKSHYRGRPTKRFLRCFQAYKRSKGWEDFLLNRWA